MIFFPLGINKVFLILINVFGCSLVQLIFLVSLFYFLRFPPYFPLFSTHLHLLPLIHLLLFKGLPGHPGLRPLHHVLHDLLQGVQSLKGGADREGGVETH